jgi:hypothetical protein
MDLLIVKALPPLSGCAKHHRIVLLEEEEAHKDSISNMGVLWLKCLCGTACPLISGRAARLIGLRYCEIWNLILKQLTGAM